MTDPARVIQLLMELRGQGISETRVLSAIEKIPRELFVPDAFADRAYENIPLPIAQGQTISQPFIVAYMTQLLEVGPRMKVLEIGTGSGYQAAVLARLCRRVYTIDRYRSLVQGAEGRFRALDLHNITTRVGDGAKGWAEQAPFDRIIVTAAARAIEPEWKAQLADGGILVAPVDVPGNGQVMIRMRREGDTYAEERLIPVRFVPLIRGVAEER